METLSCLLVEDEPLAIDMMERYIKNRQELKLLGIAKDQEQFEDMVKACQPRIVFMDVGIPPGDLNRLKKIGFAEGSLVIVVSGYPKSVYSDYILHPFVLDLPKPVSRRSFDALVDKALESYKFSHTEHVRQNREF